MKRLAALWFIIFSCALCHAITLGETETKARYLLRDNVTPYRYSSALIYEMAREGQDDMVGRTWCLDNKIAVALTTGTTEYTIPSDVLSVYRVTIGTSPASAKYIEEKTLKQLDGKADWSGVLPSTPSCYFLSYNRIGVNPPPAAAFNNAALTVYYAQKASSVTATTDNLLNNINIISPYAQAVAYYIASRCYGLDGEAEKEKWAWALYLDIVNTMQSQLLRRPNYKWWREPQ